MAEYDDMAAIPMDGSVEIQYEEPKKIIPEGEYLFRIEQMKREQQNATDKMPRHVNVKFMLRLENEDGPVGTAWDNLRMYMKWMWKFAEIAKSIGHTPVDSNTYRIDWDKFIGAEGRVKVTVKDWKKNDGTTEQQNNFKYLPPAVDDGEQPF